jgi:hypothetical protein
MLCGRSLSKTNMVKICTQESGTCLRKCEAENASMKWKVQLHADWKIV